LTFDFPSLDNLLMITIAECALTCEAVAWTHEGSHLSHDEQHAFRYEVRERGNLIGFITADRARQHPSGARWRPSRLGGIELDGDYTTVVQALAAFSGLKIQKIRELVKEWPPRSGGAFDPRGHVFPQDIDLPIAEVGPVVNEHVVCKCFYQGKPNTFDLLMENRAIAERAARLSGSILVRR
jgi:hypothetical protein